MILRKAIVLGAVMAMSSAPALAAPGHGHGYGGGHGHGYGRGHGRGHGHGHGYGQGRGHGYRHGHGYGHGDPNGSKPPAPHCVAHETGYVASGTLVSDTLVEGANHTYSGEVTVAVQHGNREASSAFGTNVTYKVEGGRVVLGVPDANGDGTVNSADLAAGDRVAVLGRISAEPLSCGPIEASQPAAWKLIFHAPRRNGHEQPSPAPVGGNGHGGTKGANPGPEGPPAPRCVPQEVSYEASGTLVSDTLTEGANHTYSGEVTVAVHHGNEQAKSGLGTNVTFKLEGVQALLGIPDANGDGVVNSADLAAGDQVDLVGSISALPKSCTPTEAAVPVISKVAFHAPSQAGEAQPSTAT